jgi:hypothetical protein
MVHRSGPEQLRDRGEFAAGEFAAYAAEMAGELSAVARRHGFDALGYLLEMARMEAESTAAACAPQTKAEHCTHRTD